MIAVNPGLFALLFTAFSLVILCAIAIAADGHGSRPVDCAAAPPARGSIILAAAPWRLLPTLSVSSGAAAGPERVSVWSFGWLCVQAWYASYSPAALVTGTMLWRASEAERAGRTHAYFPPECDGHDIELAVRCKHCATCWTGELSPNHPRPPATCSRVVDFGDGVDCHADRPTTAPGG